ncbi:hypothetical protein J3459_014826 [Metarhizium acridum]|nr:hypothetical protein J3459_014826 [Metarhizium acridum]
MYDDLERKKKKKSLVNSLFDIASWLVGWPLPTWRMCMLTSACAAPPPEGGPRPEGLTAERPSNCSSAVNASFDWVQSAPDGFEMASNRRNVYCCCRPEQVVKCSLRKCISRAVCCGRYRRTDADQTTSPRLGLK